MKRVIALALFVLFTLSMMAFAGSRDFKIVRGRDILQITVDTGSDSTIQTGSANLSFGFGDAKIEGFTSLLGKVYLSDPRSVYTGVGNADSGWIWLYTTFNNETHLLDSAVCEDLPCSLRVVYAASTAGSDTLLKEHLQLDWKIYDSISDTLLTFRYFIDYDFYLQ